MNLEFHNVKRILLNNREYILQRADVTDNGPFWQAWRWAKYEEAQAKSVNAVVPTRSLQSVISLSRILRSGKLGYHAFRLLPVESGLPLGKFALSYSIKRSDKLLSYQPRAVELLCNSIVCNGSALDGSDTGIGKTYHAIGVCREMILVPAIVCRKAGISTWFRVCQHFDIRPLFVVNWESAKAKTSPIGKYLRRGQHPITGEILYRWQLPQNVLLIFDEAHMASIDGSQNNALWKASKGLPALSLSATFADRASRLKTLFYLLNIVDRAFFDRWLLEQGHFINSKETYESLSDLADMKAINKVLYPRYGCRISYDDSAVKTFFPAAVYQTEIIFIGDREQKRQNEIYRKMLVRVQHYKELGKQAEALNADLRYRQVAELLKLEGIIDLAQDYREQRRSVLIFVNFRESLAYLAKRFETRSVVYGGQEKQGIDRDKVIDDFQNEKTTIMILMAQAGGQSISLHDIHGKRPRISLICPTYDPIVLKQILGRTHRAGSKSKPIIKLVYAAGTIEEKVAETVNRKLDNIAALNDGDLMEPDLFKLTGARK